MQWHVSQTNIQSAFVMIKYFFSFTILTEIAPDCKIFHLNFLYAGTQSQTQSTTRYRFNLSYLEYGKRYDVGHNGDEIKIAYGLSIGTMTFDLK